MSEQKMYRFHVDFGRHGDIDGVFCATPEEVAAAVGVHVWFEEPWGKHSSADCTIEAGHFSVLTDDQDFIAKAKLPDDKILSVPRRCAATRFESFDAARETIALMLARGDSWANRARPSRLVGTKTIRRSPTTEAAS